MKKIFSVSEKSEIIEMALSDHISFGQIEKQFGIKEKDVKKLMKKNLLKKVHIKFGENGLEFFQIEEKTTSKLLQII